MTYKFQIVTKGKPGVNFGLNAVMLNDAAAVEAAGFIRNGESKSYADAPKGAAVPREMLWSQPKFEGLCGPMYGEDETGSPCLRYESWEAYEMLSR